MGYNSKMCYKYLSLLSLWIIVFSLITTMFYACTEGELEVEEGTVPQYSEVEKAPQIDDDAVYYMLPSALQIARIFKRSGLKYYANVINDPRNTSLYISDSKKLQNIGVYSADLCYLALNKQAQEERRCLKAMMDLSTDMGYGSIFPASFLERFEKNISNEDSMISILAQLQERLDYYLQDAEKGDQSIIIFSGAWLESVYISLSGYRLEGDKNGLSVRVSEQLVILKALISNLENIYNPTDDVKTITSELKELLLFIKGLTFINDMDVKEQTSINKVPISETELKELMDKIDSLRAKVISA